MSEPQGQPGPAGIRLSSSTGRWIVAAAVLGSGIAGIDSTVVNIALPDIGRDLHADFAALQWTVTSYTLTLAAFILLGGSLGDRFGRRRIFVIGTVWFAVASLLCALAPSEGALIAARAVQGIGGALLTPASLAVIQASFAEEDRGRAIGAWSGIAGTATAIAPFVGGWLLAVGSWRWVFLINLPLSVLVVALTLRHVPETRDEGESGRLDALGSLLGVIGLGGVTMGVIAASDHRVGSVRVWLPALVGVAGLAGFLWAEKRERHPMMPLSLFASRQFSAANAVTFLLYAVNGGAFLLLVVELQTVSGFSPLQAGTAMLPITVIMLLLSARFGALAQRIGPRLQMTVGPLISAVGIGLYTRLGPDSSYWRDVLPATAVMGIGLAVFVAPLTATVLAAVPSEHAGIASGVNNAVARAAALLAVAALPVVAGLSGSAYEHAAEFLPPFRRAMWICVVLYVAGGVLAAFTIRTLRPVAHPAHSADASISQSAR